MTREKKKRETCLKAHADREKACVRGKHNNNNNNNNNNNINNNVAPAENE